MVGELIKVVTCGRKQEGVLMHMGWKYAVSCSGAVVSDPPPHPHPPSPRRHMAMSGNIFDCHI